MLPFEEMLQHNSPLDVLRESEQRYRTLFEASADGILLITDKVIDCNLQAHTMFGRSKEDLIGASPLDISPLFQPDGRLSEVVAKEHISRALNGSNQDFAWVHLHQDGHEIHVEVSLRLVKLSGQRVLQATIRDITARKQSEEQVRLSEERFRSLYHSMSLGMALLEIVFDEDGKPCDYRYLDINPSYGRYIGQSPESVMGKTYSELNIGMVSRWLEQYGEVARTGIPKRGEITRAGKHYEIYAYSPQPGQVANLVTDVSDSKDMQQLLARRNSMLQKVSEYAAEYLNLPFATVDYQRVADHLLTLTEAAYVILNLYDITATKAETVAVAHNNSTLGGLERLFGPGIVGNTWNITSDLLEVYAAGELRVIDNLHFIAFRQLDERVCRIIENVMGTGRIYGMGLVDKGEALGNIVLVLPKGRDLESPELVEIFARTVTSVLKRKRTDDALRVSEEKYRLLIEHSPSAIILYDLDGTILLANQRQAVQHGYSTAEDLIGKSVFDLVARQDWLRLTASMSERVQGMIDRNVERTLVRKDGSEFIGEVTASVIMDGAGKPVAIQAISQDITERRLTEDRLRYLSLHDQLTGLYNRAYFEAELERLDGGREHPVSIISADLDGLKLINDTFGHKRGDELLQAGASLLRMPLRKNDLLARIGGDEFTLVLPRTDASAAEVVARRLRDAIEDYNVMHPDLPISFSLGVATNTDSAKPLDNTYREADDLMYKDKLYRKPSSRGQTVNALLAALAERDYIADGHASRMQLLCTELGEWAGLSSKQLTDLSLFAQVHDLGKVGIPDYILFKDGPLSADEWEIMRQHPEKGYRIASASPALAGVADLILRHHERWDGKGYPLGIIEQEIPIECRILSIVDAYDAMTNDRPYRKAKTEAEARLEIQRCAGYQFDPYLVQGFLSILGTAN